MKTTRYRDILEYDKINTMIDGKTVKELETELSKINSNSCDFENCKIYIKKKNEISNKLKEYYEKEIHRQLKWYSYLNKMRTDANLINRFREKFGSPKEVVILIGDFGAYGGTLKGSEPVKGKSIRKLFKQAGYKVYLVDEYNTSKYMYMTGEPLEKFRKRKSPKPYKKDKGEQLVHGLLRTKSKTSDQEAKSETILVNRDKVGSSNILHKGRNVIYGRDIPKYLERTYKGEEKQEIKKRIKIKKEYKKVRVIKRKKINPDSFIDYQKSD